MSSFIRRNGFRILLWSLVAVAVIAILYAQYSDKQGNKMPVMGQATDFELANIAGDPVRLSESDGKVRLVYFFYTHCPDVCIPTSAMLGKIRDELQAADVLGDQTEIFSITFDPVRDTPERLAEFAGRHGADSNNWQFLRGEEEEIKELALTYGIGVYKDEDSLIFAHNNRVFLIDKKGNIRMSYREQDDNWSFKSIAADMVKLTKES